MRTPKYTIIAAISLFVCLSAFQRGMASTILTTYTGGGADDNWYTPENWDTGVVPDNGGGNDYEVVIPPSSGRVTVNGFADVRSVRIGAGAELFIDTPGALASINGPIENDGLISFSTTPGNHWITPSFDGAITFTGTGTVRINDAYFGGEIIGLNGFNTLTNEAGHTIEGYGAIGESIELAVNRGLIKANVPGEPLEFIPNEVDLDGGELRAESGGILRLENPVITGRNGGSISVEDDSTVILRGATMEGVWLKALDSDGDLANNRLEVETASTIRNCRNDGTIVISDDSNQKFLYVAGTVENNGEILSVEAGNSSTGIFLSLDQDVVISGSGQITLTEGPAFGVTPDVIAGAGGFEALVHGSGHTIAGSGRIGEGIELFENHGLIHSNLGGVLEIPKWGVASFFNERGGVLRATNNSEIRMPGFSSDGRVITQRGLIEIEDGSFLDAGFGQPSPGGALLPTQVVMEEGELRIDGVFETDVLLVSSGLISGGGEIRTYSTTCAENVVFRPGNPVGPLTFVNNDPTSPFPACGGIVDSPNGGDLPSYTDVVQLGGSTFDLDIVSPGEHDEVRFDGTVYADGSVRLKLNFLGSPSSFNSSDRLVIVSDATVNYERRDPKGELVDCGGSLVRVSPTSVGGLTIANLPQSGYLTSYDGRATFRVITDPLMGSITLTEPFFSTQLPVENYNFTTPELTMPGSVVATIEPPASMTGVPRYAIVGDAPFEIDPDTGVVTVSEFIDFETQAGTYDVTINVFDGETVQVNETTITILDVVETNEQRVFELLAGPGGVFEGETDPAIVGATADPDNDGQINAFELWRNTDPSVANPSPLGEIKRVQVGQETRLALEVTVNPEVDDALSIDGMLSFDLDAFRTGTRQVLSEGVEGRRVRFLDATALDGPRGFGRFEFDPAATN